MADDHPRLKISASKIMMPLSFAAIVGGTCTVIGTSTNLIVNDIASDAGFHIGVFELSKLGIILVVVTLGYVLFAQKWILPSRVPVSSLTQKLEKFLPKPRPSTTQTDQLR